MGHALLKSLNRKDPPPLAPESHTVIGFLVNTDPDPLGNHKVTKPAFNVGTLSARLRN